jgi:hypothetical protein
VRATALGFVGGLADEAAGESLTVPWIAVNKPALRTGTALFGFFFLLTSNHPTARLLVKLTIGVVVVLVVLEVLGRPPKRRAKKG